MQGSEEVLQVYRWKKIDIGLQVFGRKTVRIDRKTMVA